MKIFRFESSIVYFNADYFRESLLNAVDIDLKTGQRRTNPRKSSAGPFSEASRLAHIIIDCSSVSQMDYSGGKIFLQAIKELNDCQYQVYLCNLRCSSFRRVVADQNWMFLHLDYNYDLLEKLEIDKACSVTIMATIHDAVHQIQNDPSDQSEQVDIWLALI